MKFTLFVSASLGLLFCEAGGHAAPPSNNSSETLQARLEEQWASMRSQLVSGRVEQRLYLRGSDYLKPDTADDLLNEVRRLNWERDFESNASRLAIAIQKDGKFPGWGSTRLVFEGTRVRADSSRATQVFDGETEIEMEHHPRHDQIDVGRPLRGIASYRRGLDDLRWIPPAQLVARRLQIEKDQSGDFLVTAPATPNLPGVLMLVDQSTCAVKRVRFAGYDGEVSQEIYQFGYTTSAEGILFPLVMIKAGFSNGRINYLAISMVGDARFNVDLPTDTFRVSAKPADVVIDHRSGQSLGTSLNRQVADVTAMPVNLPAAQGEVGAVATRSRGWSFSVFMLANGLVLMVVGIFLWRRRRGRSRPPQ